MTAASYNWCHSCHFTRRGDPSQRPGVQAGWHEDEEEIGVLDNSGDSAGDKRWVATCIQTVWGDTINSKRRTSGRVNMWGAKGDWLHGINICSIHFPAACNRNSVRESRCLTKLHFLSLHFILIWADAALARFARERLQTMKRGINEYCTTAREMLHDQALVTCSNALREDSGKRKSLFQHHSWCMHVVLWILKLRLSCFTSESDWRLLQMMCESVRQKCIPFHHSLHIQNSSYRVN